MATPSKSHDRTVTTTGSRGAPALARRDDPEDYIEWEAHDADDTLGAGTALDEADVLRQAGQVLCAHKNEGHEIQWVVIRESRKGVVSRKAYSVDFNTEAVSTNFHEREESTTPAERSGR